MVPVRKFSTSTSARATRALATATSVSERRSRVMLCLERLTHSKYDDPLPVHGGPHCRVSSPVPGRSTLTTSAPRSASVMVARGPASTRVKSATRTPSSGSVHGDQPAVDAAWHPPRVVLPQGRGKRRGRSRLPRHRPGEPVERSGADGRGRREGRGGPRSAVLLCPRERDPGGPVVDSDSADQPGQRTDQARGLGVLGTRRHHARGQRTLKRLQHLGELVVIGVLGHDRDRAEALGEEP